MQDHDGPNRQMTSAELVAILSRTTVARARGLAAPDAPSDIAEARDRLNLPPSRQAQDASVLCYIAKMAEAAVTAPVLEIEMAKLESELRIYDEREAELRALLHARDEVAKRRMVVKARLGQARSAKREIDDQVRTLVGRELGFDRAVLEVFVEGCLQPSNGLVEAQPSTGQQRGSPGSAEGNDH